MLMYTIEEYDREKTKVLKYVIYRKRTEQEIRRKFKSDIESDLLEDIIEELKENKYIDDQNYISRSINDFIALKNLSIKEIKYKLLSKGVSANLIDDYIEKNREELDEYERKSAENIVLKKSVSMDEMQIEQYLMKKGYSEENRKNALDKIEE